MPRQAKLKPLSLLTLTIVFGMSSLPAVAGLVDHLDCKLVVDRRSQNSGLGMRHFTKMQEALDAAAPGDVVCVRSPDHGSDRLRITRSGTSEAPIRIVAAATYPVLTAGFVIEADYVTVEGFQVRNAGSGESSGRGYGIYIAGTGVKVIGNSIIDSEYDGIGCELYPPGCIDVTIAGNVVRGANGSGIVVGGRETVVEENEVYGSVSKGDQDADGIRFFGVSLTLRGNHIHDISAAGYPRGQEPHTDCFQTFDDNKPATSDIVIEENVCENVDGQCLIATALTKRSSVNISFRKNYCRVSNSQAVLVRAVPGCRFIGNIFAGDIWYRAIMLMEGSTHAILRDNVFQGPFWPYEVDSSSQLGFAG